MYAIYTLNHNEWEWELMCNNLEQALDMQQFYEYELGTASYITRISTHTDDDHVKCMDDHVACD